jgi:hypothetical protein
VKILPGFLSEQEAWTKSHDYYQRFFPQAENPSTIYVFNVRQKESESPTEWGLLVPETDECLGYLSEEEKTSLIDINDWPSLEGGIDV